MADSGPVFVLGGGQRCGSTLIQRLLIASGHIWCWGEHGGLIRQLADADYKMRRWKLGADRDQLAAFDQGRSIWIPNMTPALPWWETSLRSFIVQWLGAGAARRGYRRWGFKEVRYSADELAWLRELFPECQVVVIVRNPEDCLRSVKAQDWYAPEWGGAPQFLAEWARLTESLWTACDQYDRCMRLRYEDVIGESVVALADLAAFLDLPPRSLPVDIVTQRIGAADQKPAELNAADEDALRDRNVAAASALVGYSSDLSFST